MLNKYPTIKYILQKGLWYLLTLFVAVSITFLLPRLGKDPFDIVLSQTTAGLSPEEVANREVALLTDFGLVEFDEHGNVLREEPREGERYGRPVRTSLFKQYISYISMVMSGDLGTSISQNRPVGEILRESMAWTIALQLPAIVLGWFIGNILGALAAYKRGVFDKVFFPMSLVSNSTPFFVFGMVLVYVMAVVMNLFPAYGGYAWAVTPGFNWAFISSAGYHYILPFLSIFPIMAGGQAIGMRSMGIYELGTDYIKYSKYLGIRENKILMYVFRNAILPQLAGLALNLGVMIGGALITEMIFSYPGLGTTLLEAVQSNDFFIIQGGALLVAITVLVANFSVDLLIGFFDPRVKAGRTGV